LREPRWPPKAAVLHELGNAVEQHGRQPPGGELEHQVAHAWLLERTLLGAVHVGDQHNGLLCRAPWRNTRDEVRTCLPRLQDLQRQPLPTEEAPQVERGKQSQAAADDTAAVPCEADKIAGERH
jgi:hypothetical protein